MLWEQNPYEMFYCVANNIESSMVSGGEAWVPGGVTENEHAVVILNINAVGLLYMYNIFLFVCPACINVVDIYIYIYIYMCVYVYQLFGASL